jgi:hypothetical protein
MPGQDTERVPQQMRPIYDAIVQFTDEVCAEHLNEEYAALARKMAAALARKRPSPLANGRVNTWACGILYTLGRVNFLFDKSQTPHLRADDLSEICGVSKSTGSAKAKAIENALKIGVFDPAWTLPSRIESNPLAWMIQVNGLIVDARYIPRPIQEEAFRKGLIPYIPADNAPVEK